LQQTQSAHEVIAELPEGYVTVSVGVGNVRARTSGGQCAQKIALSRLYAQAEVLILMSPLLP
jgi:ABC-type protease/lipase transport system fused ATPase/permease subunit